MALQCINKKGKIMNPLKHHAIIDIRRTVDAVQNEWEEIATRDGKTTLKEWLEQRTEGNMQQIKGEFPRVVEIIESTMLNIDLVRFVMGCLLDLAHNETNEILDYKE